MLGEEHRLNLDCRYRKVMLKDIPPSWLIFMYDKGYLQSDIVAKRFVSNNYSELKEKAKNEKK